MVTDQFHALCVCVCMILGASCSSKCSNAMSSSPSVSTFLRSHLDWTLKKRGKICPGDWFITPLVCDRCDNRRTQRHAHHASDLAGNLHTCCFNTHLPPNSVCVRAHTHLFPLYTICGCSRMLARIPPPRVLLPHTHAGWMVSAKKTPTSSVPSQDLFPLYM